MAVKTAAGSAMAQESAGSMERFSKGQLMASGKYAPRRDLLDALLDGGKAYTIQETDAAIEGYMKGKVV